MKKYDEVGEVLFALLCAARIERDQAIAQRDRARDTACRLLEEYALVVGAWPATEDGLAHARDDMASIGNTLVEGPR